MAHKNFYLFIFLFYISIIKGQVGGEEIYQFLNLPTAARQVALGGEVLTLVDDVNQPIWNPSVINSDLSGKLSANYTSYLAGINIGSISFAKEVNRRFGTLHGSIKYIDYGSLIGSDEQGNETGQFNARDIAISIGYAIKIPKTHFFIGSNFRLINATISNFSSVGISSDIAILYNNPYKNFVVTLVARNLGTQLQSFNGKKETLPFKIALGGSYLLEHVPLKWYLTLNNIQQWDLSVANPSERITDLEGNVIDKNIGFIANTFRHLIVGAELFPKKAVNLRLGYNFRRAAELKLQNVRTFSGFSFGFGIKMKKFKLNYAYSKFHSAANASTFSLLIDIDNAR